VVIRFISGRLGWWSHYLHDFRTRLALVEKFR
jgi:hypothetical protein